MDTDPFPCLPFEGLRIRLKPINYSKLQTINKENENTSMLSVLARSSTKIYFSIEVIIILKINLLLILPLILGKSNKRWLLSLKDACICIATSHFYNQDLGQAKEKERRNQKKAVS